MIEGYLGEYPLLGQLTPTLIDYAINISHKILHNRYLRPYNRAKRLSEIFKMRQVVCYKKTSNYDDPSRPLLWLHLYMQNIEYGINSSDLSVSYINIT